MDGEVAEFACEEWFSTEIINRSRLKMLLSGDKKIDSEAVIGSHIVLRESRTLTPLFTACTAIAGKAGEIAVTAVRETLTSKTLVEATGEAVSMATGMGNSDVMNEAYKEINGSN